MVLHDGELEDDADGEEDAVHGHEAQPVQLARLEPAQRQHREGEPEADAEAGRQHQGHLGALCSTGGGQCGMGNEISRAATDPLVLNNHREGPNFTSILTVG